MAICNCKIIKTTGITYDGTNIVITVVPTAPIDRRRYILCLDGIPLPGVTAGTNPPIVISNDGETIPMLNCAGNTLRYFEAFCASRCARSSAWLVTYGTDTDPHFVAYRGIGKNNAACWDGYTPAAAPEA